jgi:hypothetical protein
MRSWNSPESKPIAPIIDSEMANARSRSARPESVSAIETERSSSTRRCRVTRPVAVSRFSRGESVPLSSASRAPNWPTVWLSCSQSSIMTRYWG